MDMASKLFTFTFKFTKLCVLVTAGSAGVATTCKDPCKHALQRRCRKPTMQLYPRKHPRARAQQGNADAVAIMPQLDAPSPGSVRCTCGHREQCALRHIHLSSGTPTTQLETTCGCVRLPRPAQRFMPHLSIPPSLALSPPTPPNHLVACMRMGVQMRVPADRRETYPPLLRRPCMKGGRFHVSRFRHRMPCARRHRAVGGSSSFHGSVGAVN